MKKYYSTNETLNEAVISNGINLTCSEDMDIIVSDEQAEEIRKIAAEVIPAEPEGAEWGFEDADDSKRFPVFYNNNSDDFVIKSFDTLEGAKAYVDEETASMAKAEDFDDYDKVCYYSIYDTTDEGWRLDEDGANFSANPAYQTPYYWRED